MKVAVQVKLKSKKEGVEVKADDSLVVRVNALPIEGKANSRVVELLAKHFSCPKTSVELVSGFKSKKKIFEIKNQSLKSHIKAREGSSTSRTSTTKQRR